MLIWFAVTLGTAIVDYINKGEGKAALSTIVIVGVELFILNAGGFFG